MIKKIDICNLHFRCNVSPTTVEQRYDGETVKSRKTFSSRAKIKVVNFTALLCLCHIFTDFHFSALAQLLNDLRIFKIKFIFLTQNGAAQCKLQLVTFAYPSRKSGKKREHQIISSFKTHVVDGAELPCTFFFSRIIGEVFACLK